MALDGILLKNAAVLLLGEGLIRLATFLMMVIVGHKLGPAGVGVLAFAMTISQYVWVASDFGLRSIGTRLVAMRLDVRSRIYKKRLTLLAFTLPAAFIVAWLAGRDAEWLTIGFALAAVPMALTPDFVAAGQHGFGKLFAYRLVVSVVLLSGLAWFALLDSRLIVLPFAIIAAYSAGAVVLTTITPDHPNADGIRLVDDELRWSLILVTGASFMLNQALPSLSIVFLSALASPVDVGIFATSHRVVTLTSSAFFMGTQVLLPRFAALDQESARQLLMRWWRVASVAGIIVSLALAFGGPFLMPALFGQTFAKASDQLALLAPMIPIEAGAALLSTFLIATGRSLVSLRAIGGAVVASLLLHALLVPAYGGTGAAIATVTAELLLLMWLAAPLLTKRMRD